MKIFTRIAPTPSGYLHTGNIFSFLITRAIADKLSGQVMLRIDDLDTGRTRPAYLRDIFETISFLDIRYDYGPSDPTDFYARYSQKLRTEQYNAFIQQLEISGLLYTCTCSRKLFNKLIESGLKRCECREKHLAAGLQDAALKIYVPNETIIMVPDKIMGHIKINLFELMGDFVVRRRDGIAAYQVSSLVDDLVFGIEYIVRGNDLIGSSAAQLYLAKIAGAEPFLSCSFLHHPLLTDADGIKLSKSAGSNSIKRMKEKGNTREEILLPVAKAAGEFLKKLY